MSYQQEVFGFISSLIGQNNIVPVPIELVRFTGDYHSAALLSQIIYWQGKGHDPDGWIWKTYEQWEQELALSKYQVSRASKNLIKMGILETKVARVRLSNGMLGDRAVHYRLIDTVFIDQLGKHLSIVESKETSLSKVKKLHFPKASNSTFLSIEQKITSKNTNDDVSEPPAPPQPDPVPEAEKEPSSSFSHHDLNNLMQAVPQERRSKQVEKRLTKALMTGLYTMAYLLDCIAYSHDKANGNFVGYLGNCIDKDYAPEGYHQESIEKRRKEEERAAREKRKHLSDIEEKRRKAEEEATLKREAEQVNALLKSIDLDALDDFIDGQGLNPFDRQRFRQGKRLALRRRYVSRFVECLERGELFELFTQEEVDKILGVIGKP